MTFDATNCLYEIVTGAMGESYVRAYVWCDSEEKAIEMFKAKHPSSIIASVRFLLASWGMPFVTDLSDSGFKIDGKED